MKAVVLQPMYLPWMGYFGMIDQADVFVFYDDVQFVRDSWQQRNRVKVPEASGETEWLKVPVINDFGQDIQSVEIDDGDSWRTEHWSTLKKVYGSDAVPYGKATAEYFDEYSNIFETIYEQEWDYLSELNVAIVRKITEILDISKPLFCFSSELGIDGNGTEKLINTLKAVEADQYISGPGAKDYLEINAFEEADISLYWHEFDHPEYNQIYGEFVSHLSIVDALFNAGNQTTTLIRDGESDALVREV